MPKKTYFCRYQRGSYILACEVYGYDQGGNRYLKSPIVVVDFRNNQLQTSDLRIQELIENSPWFGTTGAEIALLHSEEAPRVVVREEETAPVANEQLSDTGPSYSSGPMAVGDEVKRDNKGRFHKK